MQATTTKAIALMLVGATEAGAISHSFLLKLVEELEDANMMLGLESESTGNIRARRYSELAGEIANQITDAMMKSEVK